MASKAFGNRINAFVNKRFARFIEINKRYSKRTIKMTPAVSLALLFLRVYLIFLVGILIYKFITLVR